MRNLKAKFCIWNWVIIFFCFGNLFAQTDSLKSEIKIEASADKLRLPLNDSLNFTVLVSWEGENNRFLLFPLKPPECTLFEVQGSSTTVETKKEEGKPKTYKKYIFVLKPTKEGRGLIGSVSLSYIDAITQDSSSISTPEIKVQINPAKKSFKLSLPVIAVISSIILLIFLIFFGVYAKKSFERKAKEKLKEVEKPKSLEKRFKEKLDSLSELLTKGENGKFLDEFYKLALSYLEEKYQVYLKGKTKNELSAVLGNLNLEEKQRDFYLELFSRSELAKFSGKIIEADESLSFREKFALILEQNEFSSV
jgi:hypothetical protein